MYNIITVRFLNVGTHVRNNRMAIVAVLFISETDLLFLAYYHTIKIIIVHDFCVLHRIVLFLKKMCKYRLLPYITVHTHLVTQQY